jgi:hypothetical protein
MRPINSNLPLSGFYSANDQNLYRNTWPFRMIFVIILLLGSLFGTGIPLLARQHASQDTTTHTSLLQREANISGEFGMYGELYSISGRTARRPSSTGRIYLSPTLTFFNSLTVPLQFFISSEGVSARQNINQFGINPSWKWGTAHLGDFTETYSDLTLNGINVRGGGITLQPGILRLSLLGGITHRAVSGHAQYGAYRRALWGGRIGVGQKKSSYIDFIYLKSKDDINSLSQNSKSISVLAPNGNESFTIGSVQLIQWASVNSSSTVKIELSRDGGSTFELLFDNQPATGAVNWTVTGPETFQAIIRVTSDDDPSITDISDYPFSIGTGNQTPPSVSPGFTNNFAVTPQENTVVGTAGQLKFPGSHFTIRAGLNGSIFTRDLRSSKLNTDSVHISSFFKTFQQPLTSSNVDYAANMQAEANFSSFNARMTYKYIGPGYHSPGLAYLISDQQQISTYSSFNVAKMRATLQWAHQNDNLIHQKQFTTARNRFGLSFGGLITPFWSSNISTNIISLQNNALNDTNRVNFSNFGFNIAQSFIISRDNVVRSLTAHYGYQNSKDKNPLRNTSSSFQTTNISLMLGITNNFIITPAVGFLYADFGTGSATLTQTYSINSTLNALHNKLNNSFSLSLTQIEKRSSFRLNLHTSYHLSSHDTAILSISEGSYNGYSASQGGNFNEFITSIRYSHRF